MIKPTKEEFIKLSKEGNLIPVYKEFIADTETPVSAFKKILGEDCAFLLESVEGGENIARYSFLGSSPKEIFKFNGNEEPFSALKNIIEKYKPVKVEGLPRFHGGLVGYLGYDTVKHIEDIKLENRDDFMIPDVQFMLTDTILAFDHVKHKILIISNAKVDDNPDKAYEEALKNIQKFEEKLKKSLKINPLDLSKKGDTAFKSNFTKEEFEKAVSKAKEYVQAGDIIQVVPSQRFEADFDGDPFDVYRILRIINPSPYMFFLKFKDVYLVGASPEVMVRFEDKKAVIRPIAGTRPRGKDLKEDKMLEKDLLASDKEKAEHIMLVDLARNDLGRVCKKDSISVTELMTIEKYSHVMHIVSNVEGILNEGLDAFDLLKASFPAGTVTGAPKIRAMEIIEELEKTKRGPYAGAVGYFSFTGEMDTCITIRTLEILNKKAYVQAGAGIVADSDPKTEYEETVNKAKGMLKAINLLK